MRMAWRKHEGAGYFPSLPSQGTIGFSPEDALFKEAWIPDERKRTEELG